MRPGEGLWVGVREGSSLGLVRCCARAAPKRPREHDRPRRCSRNPQPWVWRGMPGSGGDGRLSKRYRKAQVCGMPRRWSVLLFFL